MFAALDFTGISLVLTAVFTGFGAILGAWGSVVASRHKSEAECHDRIMSLRAESERFAEELHQMKMKQWVRSVEMGVPASEA